jgi:atypical dual specificity phosphatase
MNHLNFSWVIEGKLAGHRAPSEPDLPWLKQQGILALVRMAEKHDTRVTSPQVAQLGLWDCHEPVQDFAPPSRGQIDNMIDFIKESLAAGRPVGVSCGAGLGRTGTILACYLVSIGFGADSAVQEVRARRPGSIETKAQEEAVRGYASRQWALPSPNMAPHTKPASEKPPLRPS